MKKHMAGLLVLAAALAFAGCSKGGQAGKYPNAPVSLVVPYSAGGGTDLVARALVDAAKTEFPKGISVENRTGGGGAVGMSYGSHAKADGSVITMVTVELVTLPHTGTGAGISYDQFKPIMMVNSAYSAITVKADSPWKSLNDLIEASKKTPVKVGNSGVGAIWHLAAAGLAKTSGANFSHIPFDGAQPAVTSLLGGHIDAVSVSYPEVSSQVKAGALRVLAILAPERLASLPDVPTAKELGYDVAIGTWRGLAVPKDTPDAIVEKLYTIFDAASKSEAFVNFMNGSNNVIDIMDGPSYASKMAADDELFKGIVSDLNLKQQ